MISSDSEYFSWARRASVRMSRDPCCRMFSPRSIRASGRPRLRRGLQVLVAIPRRAHSMWAHLPILGTSTFVCFVLVVDRRYRPRRKQPERPSRAFRVPAALCFLCSRDLLRAAMAGPAPRATWMRFFIWGGYRPVFTSSTAASAASSTNKDPAASGCCSCTTQHSLSEAGTTDAPWRYPRQGMPTAAEPHANPCPPAIPAAPSDAPTTEFDPGGATRSTRRGGATHCQQEFLP